MMLYDYCLQFQGFKFVVAIWAALESFLLSGVWAGWASLVYVLKQEGIYQDLCQNTTNISLNISPQNSLHYATDVMDRAGTVSSSEPVVVELTADCSEQDAMFELCVTISSVICAPINLLMSHVNFSFGIRTVRILSTYLSLHVVYQILVNQLRSKVCDSLEMVLLENPGHRVLFLTGTVCFGVISTGYPWLIFLGHIFISSGGMGIMQTNYQVSYMFDRCSSTVIGLICGAFDASVAVFLCVKVMSHIVVFLSMLAYEQGVPLSTSFLVIGCINILAVINTFFFLPKDFIRSPSAQQASETEYETLNNKNDITSENMSEKTKLLKNKRKKSRSILRESLHQSPQGHGVSETGIQTRSESGIHTRPESAAQSCSEEFVFNTSCLSPSRIAETTLMSTEDSTSESLGKGKTTSSKNDEDVSSKGEKANCSNTDKTQRPSLWKYIFSPLYFFQTFWLSVNQITFILFLGSLNAWLGHITDGNVEKVSRYTNFIFSVMMSAPLFSFLSGASVDCLHWIQSDSRNPKTKDMYSLAGPSAFTSLIGLVMCSCVVVEKQEVTYFIGVITVTYRSALYSYWGSFLRVMYPTDYFAALYGIMLVFCGVLTFLQYPLFLWCQSSDSGYRQVYGMLGLMTLFTFSQPLYLIYTGWKIDKT